MISKLFKHSLLYKIYDFFNKWIKYNKIKRTVGKSFYSNEFKLLMSNYLKVNLKEDWIGRLYGVVNPTINTNGELDFSTMVIELDGEKTNNDAWAQTWIYKQLNLVSQLFRIRNLYDYINLEIEHVGPVYLDNYLIIFDLVDRKSFANSAKSLALRILFWGIIVGIFFIFNGFFHLI